MKAKHSLILAALSLGQIHAMAENSTDKNQFNLLNPTPPELMRELSTDRPDKTESAYTVDAGHFQIEADILNYSYDRYNAASTATRTEGVSIAPINLKVGLWNSADFQLVLAPYTSVRSHDLSTGVVDKNRGFGDIITRMKINLWGNDGGKTAFAIMPFVKFPSNQDGLGNHAFEGGVILPLAVELSHGWGMGIMTQVDFNEDGDGSGYHPDFINTITFSHGIVGELGGYVEFASSVSAESGSEWIGTVDLGATYGLSKNVQLDAGINIGVTRSADDFNPFMGISWRF